MMRPVNCLLALGVLVAFDANAQRVALDDSLSPVDTIAVTLEWEPGTLRRALGDLMAGVPNAGPPLTGRADNVEVRLDTREFVGESARIYLTLPPVIANLGRPGDFELGWNATPPFIPGFARPGQSMLVFEGAIESPITSAVFSFSLKLDRGADTDVFDVEPYYELEIFP